MRVAAILTAGCRLNQSESDMLRARLVADGFTVVDEPGRAERCYVNTCSVTSAADRSSVQLVRRVSRLALRPSIVVLGCLAQRAPEKLRDIPGVSEVWDNARKQAELAGRVPAPARSRALLKVQDGCDRACAFCVVSGLRGRPSSLPAREAAERLRSLQREGFSEVVLTGLNLGLYRDLSACSGRAGEDGFDLVGLVRLLLNYTAVPRIRLGSLEPDVVLASGRNGKDDLLSVVADGRVAPHFHFALQSGDDRVLALAGRRYRAAEFAGAVRALREARPDANIGLDVIAGLPGETEAAFERTRELLLALAPGYLHVFSFSPRPGTRASRMPRPISGVGQKQRVRVLRAMSSEFRQEFQGRFDGAKRSAVVEHGASALSDNYLKFTIEGPCSARPRSMADFVLSQRSGRMFGTESGNCGESQSNRVAESRSRRVAESQSYEVRGRRIVSCEEVV